MRSVRPGKPDDGRLLRIMAAVGGLDSPLYDDERARSVWYEASAIGVNLALWGGLVLATVMIWVGGAPLLWWSVALFGLTILIAVTTTQYAARRRAHIDLDHADARSSATLAVMLLVTAYAVGLGRAALELTGPHEPGAGAAGSASWAPPSAA